jgi:hypothetical protein
MIITGFKGGTSPVVRRYGQWAGDPRGVPEDMTCCVQSVWERCMEHQCLRKRGFGIDSYYCRQHARDNPFWIDDSGSVPIEKGNQ